MKFNWFRGLSIYSIFFWPALVDIFGFTFFPKKSVDFFRKTVNTIINHRTANNVEHNDLVDALLKLKREGLEDGKEFNDDLLAAQCTVMLQGGFDTSAVAMTFITYELAHAPELQEKLYKEISEAKEKNDGAEFNVNDYEKLIYLDAVIKEGLRRYPAMGWLDRNPKVDYKINDSLTIPRNTPVFINAIGMHHDPKFFPEPFKFDPDRFLPENKDKIIPYTYLPFGDGPRMCIGKRFAIMNIRYLLCTLVLNYEVRPLPGYVHPKDMKYEEKSPFLMPSASLSVEFIPRN